MADRKKRLDSNVSGNFYVDSTCINCDTCRQLARKIFQEVGDYSAVTVQPARGEDVHRAYQALLACPVGSIGTERSDRTALGVAMASFPLEVDGGVFYCGFNSARSFGANSYFIEHQDGNWLVDSPRYMRHLVDSFERRGGIRCIFLTHEDDVADADKYAAHFGARRIIHRADARAVPDAEWIVDGRAPVSLGPEFLMIPVPGHTAGSSALLYRDRYLFTGDHLWWEPGERRLGAPRRLVWNPERLRKSVEALLDYRFEWVLAGHGDRVRLSVDEMQNELNALLDRRTPFVRT